MGAPLRDSEYIPANTETTSKFIDLISLGLEILSPDLKPSEPYSFTYGLVLRILLDTMFTMQTRVQTRVPITDLRIKMKYLLKRALIE